MIRVTHSKKELKSTLPSKLVEFFKSYKKDFKLYFTPEYEMFIADLRSFAENGSKNQRKEAQRILRRLKPKNKNLLFIRERPDLLLFQLDNLEGMISKEMRKSYKGRPRGEKENDARALYYKLFNKPKPILDNEGKKSEIKRNNPVYPKKKKIDLRSKRTIAISFFCVRYHLPIREIRDMDRYWNGIRKKDPCKYHPMLSKASQQTVKVFL